MKKLKTYLLFISLIIAFTGQSKEGLTKVVLENIYLKVPADWVINKSEENKLIVATVAKMDSELSASLVLKATKQKEIKDKRFVNKLHSHLSSYTKGLNKRDWKNMKVLPRSDLISCVYLKTLSYVKEESGFINNYLLFSCEQNGFTYVGCLRDQQLAANRPYLADVNQILGSICYTSP